MKITWLGHACFQISSAQGQLVIDPYDHEKVPGLSSYQAEADEILVTHEHFDHNYRAAVTLTEKKHNYDIDYISAFHDDQLGALRGPMKLYLISDRTYRVAHFGDLGHPLSPDQIRKAGTLDALMINVGGFEKSEAEFAMEIIGQLDPIPRIILPFHFRSDRFGFPRSGTVEEFTDLSGHTLVLPGATADLDVLIPEIPEGDFRVILFPEFGL